MNALTPRNPETPQNSLYGALRGHKAISAVVVRRFIVSQECGGGVLGRMHDLLH